jgi:hypothetical protein
VHSKIEPIKKISAIDVQSGGSITILTEQMSKPAVFVFLSKDCPCSRGNLSYIQNLSQTYPDFRFIGIHSKRGTNLAEVKEYLADKDFKIEVLNDSQLEIASLFKALKTPHAFIVDQKGDVLYNGGITNSTFPKNAKEFFLKNALEDLKNNRKIARAETKTLGCFIMR